MTSHKRPTRTPGKGHGPLRIDYWEVGKVKPSPDNSRSHSPAQIDELARMISSPVGWTKPIIIDEKGVILAGHGAYQAALQLGMETVPVIMRAGLTAAQKKAYRIADNKLAEKSAWDPTILGKEFAELQRMGFDMSMTGFDPSEIEFILAPPPAVPPTSPEPKIERRMISKLGDVWHLGEHRLICGDSTKPATYKALMGGRLAQCVFTDPPYGISYEAPSGAFEQIKGDELRRGQLKTMLKDALGAALPHTREDAGWYVWHAASTRYEFTDAMRDIGLVELCLIIWEKPGATLGWSDYRQAHEPCFYAARQGVKPAFHGDRTHTTIWRLESRSSDGQPTSIGGGVILTTPSGEEIYVAPRAPKGKKLRHLHVEPGKPILLAPKTDVDDVWAVGRDTGHGKDDAIHPTMKPVELSAKACRNSAKEGEIILDLFGGSCSTMIGAEQTGRVAYVVELDPRYVDAGVRRWQDLTGKEATHGTEKKTFEAIAKARGKA